MPAVHSRSFRARSPSLMRSCPHRLLRLEPLVPYESPKRDALAHEAAARVSVLGDGWIEQSRPEEPSLEAPLTRLPGLRSTEIVDDSSQRLRADVVESQLPHGAAFRRHACNGPRGLFRVA